MLSFNCSILDRRRTLVPIAPLAEVKELATDCVEDDNGVAFRRFVSPKNEASSLATAVTGTTTLHSVKAIALVFGLDFCN